MTARHETLENGTVWPTSAAAGELEHKLRYQTGPPLSRNDGLVLASICSAYIHLREQGAETHQATLERIAKAIDPKNKPQLIVAIRDVRGILRGEGLIR